MPYDERRASVAFICLGQGICDGQRIVAVYFDDVPLPCAVFCGHVFRVNSVHHGRQLHFVGVIEHYQVSQAQMSGYASGPL